MTSLLLLQALTFVLICLALGLATYAVLSAPVMPAERLGLRGHKRTLALRDQASFSAIEPVIRWLSTRLGGLVPLELRARLDRQITRAGDVFGFQPADIVSICVMTCVLGLGAGAVYCVVSERGYFLALVAAMVGAIGPYLALNNAAEERARSIQRALPHVVDLMVLGLSAGLDLPASVRQIVDKAGRADEPLIEELRLVLQEFKLGRTRKQALAQFAERVPCEAVRDLVAAVTQSEEQGTPLAAVLATQANASRQRRSVEAEETAARAGTGMMLPLGLLFATVLLLIVSPMALSLGATLGE